MLEERNGNGRERLTLHQTTDILDSNGVPADLSPESVSESSEGSVTTGEKIDVGHGVVAARRREEEREESVSRARRDRMDGEEG